MATYSHALAVGRKSASPLLNARSVRKRYLIGVLKKEK